MAKPDDEMMDDLLSEEGTEGQVNDEDMKAFDDALNTASDIFYRRVESANDMGEAPAKEAPPVKIKPGSPRPKISLKNFSKSGG